MLSRFKMNEEGLLALKNYKYVSGGYSWLDNKINPFWEWFVSCMPTVLYFINCTL